MISKTNNKPYLRFKNNLEKLIDNLDSLMLSLNSTMGLTSIFFEINQNKLKDFSKKYSDKKNKKRLFLSGEEIEYYKKLKKETNISVASLNIVPKNTLVSLVSQFDAFMTVLVSIILDLKPEILSASEKTLTYNTLTNLGTISDAKKYIIEKEIESILRDNHASHFGWIEKRIGIPLTKDLKAWSQFIELTERRNLFAHNGGIVSSHYLAACKEIGVKSDNLKIGDEIDVTPEYLQASYECLYELATKLTHVLWRKLLPKDIQEADSELNRICYDLIETEAYARANVLLEFATDILPKTSDDTHRKIFTINRALSLKLGGDMETASKIVNRIDWSACSSDFKLARSVILNEIEEVYALMKKIGKSGEYVEKDSYRTWPLFRNLRKSKKFKELFKKIYKEDLDLKKQRLEYDIRFTVKPKSLKFKNKITK